MMKLKKINILKDKKLDSWQAEVNAKFPTEDLDFNQEKAQIRHDRIINEFQPELEQRRKDILSEGFKPNDEWWGSKVTKD